MCGRLDRMYQDMPWRVSLVSAKARAHGTKAVHLPTVQYSVGCLLWNAGHAHQIKSRDRHQKSIPSQPAACQCGEVLSQSAKARSYGAEFSNRFDAKQDLQEKVSSWVYSLPCTGAGFANHSNKT